jgi:LysM repeat protein
MRKLLASLLFVSMVAMSMAQSKPAVTTHVVEKGETLYSISKKYHVTVEAIEKANKSLGADFKLKIGQKLIIPSATAQIKDVKADKPVASTPKSPKPEANSPKPQSKPNVAPVSSSSDPSVHIVTKGETVYAIAKANGLTWKQLKDANHLSDDMKLKLGQKLIIPARNPEAMYNPAPRESQSGVQPVTPKPKTVPATTEQGKDYLTSQPPVIKKEPTKQPEPIAESKPTESAPIPIAVAPAKTEKPKEATQDENPFVRPAEAAKPAPKEPVKEVIKNENVNPSDYATVFGQYSDSGKKKVVYRGIGTFMKSDNPGNQFLAFYNYADMGSILKVTNLMSKEMIYVKVIGKVPAADAQKDVILKISNDAASKLKVSEDRFLVEVTGFNVQ